MVSPGFSAARRGPARASSGHWHFRPLSGMLRAPLPRRTPLLTDRPNTATEIEPFLSEVKERVDRHLQVYFQQKRARAAALSAPSEELVAALDDFTMRGGKRTRPAVLVAGHMAVQESTDLNALLDACAGLELLQSYLLVHDDWMDQDDERRGGTTLHKLFADRHKDVHLGASLAILAGDLGNGFAIELVARTVMPEANRPRALEVFWEMQQDVVWGQALDLIAYQDVALIQRLKTGSYSVKGPLLLGAVIGGASPQQQAALAHWADPVGQAFQVRDDVLGVFGAPEKTGKPAGNDLRAGKRTVLVEEAEKRVSKAELAALYAVLGKADASETAVQKAMDLLEACGARAAVEARIERLCSEATEALRLAPLTREGSERLEQLARKFAYRDR
jgi:geranylgeranyl diphosphate synthase type I